MAKKKTTDNIIEVNYTPQRLPQVSFFSWWLPPDPDLGYFENLRVSLLAEIKNDLNERNLDQYSSLSEPAARIKTQFELALIEQVYRYIKYCSLSAARIHAENETMLEKLNRDISILEEFSNKLNTYVDQKERKGEKQ